MSEPLRVAVVGLGYWGPNLVRNFASTPGCEVSWVCDVDPARLAAIERSQRVGRATTRFDDVLSAADVDAVVLATPLGTHRSLGEAALRAGKHLWVEKPLAPTVEDARALAALAREKDLRLLVDHTFVYSPAVRKIRDLVARGELGQVLYFDSVRVNLGLFQSDTNVVWDLGPHDVSIARHVLGAQPRLVSAVAFKHVAEAQENLAYLTLRYEGSLVAHFHLSWLAPIKLRTTMIGGTSRMIVYNDLEPVEKVRIYDRGVSVRADESAENRRRALASYRTGDLWSPAIEPVEALSVAAADFAAAIRERRAPLSDGEAGVAVVQVLAAAERSIARQGEPVAP